MASDTRTPVSPGTPALPAAASRIVLDPTDLRQLAHLAARVGASVRHVLLAAVASLLHRHAELGPLSLALDLSGSFPSAFPDASADVHPLALPVDGAAPFAHVVRSAAAAEASATSAASPERRAFAHDTIPYRLRVSVPAGWGAAPASANGAGSHTFALSLQADEGLVLAADGATLRAADDVDVQVVSLFRRLRPLLDAAAADPESPVARLPILTPGERHEILTAWNDTRTPLSPLRCAHQLVEAQVARTPHVTAVRSGDRSLTYRQLDEQANRLARDLQSRGVGPDALVGICLERGTDMLAAVLATLKAGGAYLPLDPHYPPDRLAFMLEDSSAAVVVTTRPVADRLGLRAHSVLCLDEEPVHLYQDVPATPPDCHAAADSLAYVIYTSGSTGKPKGVQIPHRAFVNFLSSMADAPGISDRDVLLAVTTLSFDIAGLDLFLPLTVGARINLLPREVATDGLALRRALESSDATILQVTPATWRMLINAGWQGTPGLRMFCGGEAMTLDLARQLLARGAELWNMYGPTETTVYSTIYRADGDASPVPIGRPIANTRCYVLDPHLQPVPVGLTGELYIAGDGLARGYLNRPDLTAERFPADPFHPGQSMYRTGDVCRYRPDGQIEYLGRNDYQVKINGFRIELGEVEDALLKLPAIRQACCTSRETTGPGGGTQLVAYIVPAATDAVPDTSEIRRALRERLPAHMVPAAVIPVAHFPLTPSGKVDRKALPSLPPLAGSASPVASAREPALPQNDTEARLVDIWKGVLRVDRLGVTDDFFELGGDSLMAVGLAVEVEKAFGRTVPLTELMPTPTIRGLAAALDGTAPASPAKFGHLIIPLRTSGSRRPLFCVPGMGGHMFTFRPLGAAMDDDRPVYGTNLPGTDGREAPGKDVPDIARQLLAQIRAVQPAGPYYFAGHSFGGLVAIEMAHMLRDAGQDSVLFFFDAFGPNFPYVAPAPVRALIHLRRALLSSWADKRQYLRDRRKNLAHRYRLWTHRFRRVRMVEDAGSVQELISQVRHSALVAERGYVYKPFDGRVVLFRALITPTFIGTSFDAVDNGWSAVCSNLQIEPMPYDHGQILAVPAINEIVRKISAVLHEIEDR